MSSEELPVSTRLPIDDSRYHEGRTVTWVSVAVNLVLTVTQIVVGIFAHAQSLVADGFHSLADLVADFMVLVANFHSRHPADAGHPYGHQRIETAASFGLGLLLAATGGGILWAAAGRIQHLENLPPVAPIALWVAAATLAAKEGLFRYMLHVGERLRSPMLIANAWHARSDAASSLVVTAGIAGSLLGYPFLDPVAALIVGFMILRMGAVFSWDALRELMDDGLSDEEVAAIRATVRSTPGVIGLHELRTRRMAQKILIDAHIQVDGHVSVSEGHRIGEEVRERVLQSSRGCAGHAGACRSGGRHGRDRRFGTARTPGAARSSRRAAGAGGRRTVREGPFALPRRTRRSGSVSAARCGAGRRGGGAAAEPTGRSIAR